MAGREWQQLELPLPVAGDAGATYGSVTPPRQSPRQLDADPAILGDAALLTSFLGSRVELSARH